MARAGEKSGRNTRRGSLGDGSAIRGNNKRKSKKKLPGGDGVTVLRKKRQLQAGEKRIVMLRKISIGKGRGKGIMFLGS